jgi:D-3-phosphoglycerate dehydrogenase
MPDEVHMLHLAPGYFDDVETERTVLSRAFDDVRIYEHGGDLAASLTDPVEVDVIATFDTPVDRELLEATDASVVAVYATGIDWVDVEAASELGVAVTRVPEYCDREVGEHVLSLALALLRGLPQYDAATSRRDWDWSIANPLRAFSELTFGFLAFGRKARSAAALAGPLGFDLVAHDPYVDDADIRAEGVTPVGMDTLLERADVLSVHLPLTDETESLLNEDAFDRLPDGAVLVNAGRGAVINETALLQALEEGSLAAAGLDVLAEEPPDSGNPLLGRTDTIVTPHVAWNSEEAIERVRARGTEYAIGALRGERSEAVVNPCAFD